jgi:hypothetical protein
MRCLTNIDPRGRRRLPLPRPKCPVTEESRKLYEHEHEDLIPDHDFAESDSSEPSLPFGPTLSYPDLYPD